MEALFTSFLAAALAEWGDKTQYLTIALAVRFRAAAPILAGVTLAALANAMLAALGGTFVHDLITLRAVSLLVAVALLLAAVGGVIGKPGPVADTAWPGGAFAIAAAGAFFAELGDKTQFLTFAIAAQYDSLVLAATGATLGVVAVSVPAVLLADRLPALIPMKPLRFGIAALFLLAGLTVAVAALRLV